MNGLSVVRVFSRMMYSVWWLREIVFFGCSMIGVVVGFDLSVWIVLVVVDVWMLLVVVCLGVVMVGVLGCDEVFVMGRELVWGVLDMMFF